MSENNGMITTQTVNNNIVNPTNEMVIELNHITKKYGKSLALDDFSLKLKGGQIVGLLGPNGSGKTTLMKIITGLIHDYSGEVIIDGVSVGPQSKSMVSFLSDEPYFPKWMKIKDAVLMYQDFYNDFDTGKCLNLLKKLDLNPSMQIKKLSKGMNEKFLLALCMSRNALVYVLDEPIGGVDPAARETILNTILTNYNENGLILISTHLVKDIEHIFDEVVFIREGQLVLHENVEQLRLERNESIDDLFIEVYRNA